MDNGSAANWGDYLRRLTDRPRWSVAKLARLAKKNPATIFNWIKGKTGEAVTIGSVLDIAEAAGVDPIEALRAAAGLIPSEPDEEEINLVLSSDIPERAKEQIISAILTERERDRRRRMDFTIEMIRIAGDREAS